MAVARLTLSNRYAGQILQNVMHFRKADFVSADLPVLLTGFRDQFLDQLRNFYVAEVQQLSLHAEIITGSGGGEIADLVLSTVGAGGSDTRVPLTLSAVLQIKTGLAGRKNRGRIYVCGITCNWLASGIFNPTNVASMQGWANTIKARWITSNVGGWNLVLLGKNDNPADARTVNDLQVRSLPGTQRRRQVGVGI